MDENMNENMRLQDWLITLIVLAIPCVNIVMLFVWAFGNTNPNRKTYCQAYLILAAIVIVLYVIIALAFGMSMAGIMQSLA